MLLSGTENTRPPRRRLPQACAPATIETSRLSLTCVTDADETAISTIFSDQTTARMTHAVPHPLSREAGKSLLTEMVAAPDRWWAIRQPDESMIGAIGLSRAACGRRDNLNDFGPHLSVFVAPAYRGQGVAPEAIDGLLERLTRSGVKIIQAAHFADNEASARMLLAADFLYTGRRTQETSMAREGEHEALHMVRIL